MDIKEIQELIRFVSKSGVSEVEIETKGFKLTIKTPPYRRNGQSEVQMVHAVQPAVAVAQPVAIAAPVAIAQPAPQAPAAKPAEEAAHYEEIKSPMIGTFYRSSSPEKPPFASVGDEVKKGDVLCIIEAMKLFNEIEAEVSGKVVKVLVDDASPVEYDQPLFLIEPH
ncbi:MAG: acetyl-CoA carboxylase biotin carboxyl carrier protein [Flavobacteriales bacterium]|nr:acetyl-CoA carboxylase biotin carboxyl carrier protein [Flavobacteriales bacterium]